MWYRWTAYNQQTLYGWTREPAVADAVTDRLNRGREINNYAAQELTEAQADALHLSKRNDLLCDDDTRADDVMDAP